MSYVSKRIVLAAVLCLCLAGCAPRDETPKFIQEQAYHVGDEAPALKAPAWKTYVNDAAAGYGPQPLWIRLNVKPIPNLDPAALIEISVQPNYLDQIDLYDVELKPNQYKSVGERFPLSNNALPFVRYTFAVPNGAAPRVILLRVKTTSTRLVQITALPLMEAMQNNVAVVIGHTLILVLLFVSLILSFYVRNLYADSLSTAFAILQTIAFFYGAVNLGFGRLLLSSIIDPEIQDVVSRYLIISYTFANFCFYYVLLLTLSLKKAFVRVLKLFLFSLLIIVPLALSELAWLSFLMNSTMLNLWAFMLLLASVWGIPWASLSERSAFIGKKFLISFSSVAVVVNSLFVFSVLNVYSVPFFNVYGAVLNGILTSFVMVYVMHIRGIRFKQYSLASLAQADQAYRKEKDLSESRRLYLDLLNHELKTPLSTILLASAGKGNGDRMKVLSDQATRSMVEVLKLSSESLAYLDEAVAPKLELMDATLLLEQAVGSHLNSNRFLLKLNSGCDVVADPILFKIVVNNLLENAVKYSPEDTQVTVSLARGDQNTVQISVMNDVSKAASLNMNRFFEKYYRSVESSRREGLGLGLYLAKALSELQHGTLDCRLVDQKICFTLNLPSREEYAKRT